MGVGWRYGIDMEDFGDVDIDVMFCVMSFNVEVDRMYGGFFVIMNEVENF